jgi:hypothetical protein
VPADDLQRAGPHGCRGWRVARPRRHRPGAQHLPGRSPAATA